MADYRTIYLVRHAIAEDRGPDYPDDRKRPLTGRGMSRFRKVARGLARLDAEVDLILSSPLVRARQTADILSEVLSAHPQVLETDALLPDATYAQLQAELGRRSRVASIALVGHMPSAGVFAARLVGSDEPFDFKKGGVCRIDVARLPPSAPGQLKWLATPKMLSGVEG